MCELKSNQRKYLRGLAHGLKPLVTIGQQGLTEAVVRSTAEALRAHELIKIKFLVHKEKEQKNAILADLSQATRGQRIGLIGHTAILYRPHPDPEKRRIQLPGPNG